jgi:hypothetical protein
MAREQNFLVKNVPASPESRTTLLIWEGSNRSREQNFLVAWDGATQLLKYIFVIPDAD